jgi:hypothetical protein
VKGTPPLGFCKNSSFLLDLVTGVAFALRERKSFRILEFLFSEPGVESTASARKKSGCNPQVSVGFAYLQQLIGKPACLEMPPRRSQNLVQQASPKSILKAETLQAQGCRLELTSRSPKAQRPKYAFKPFIFPSSNFSFAQLSLRDVSLTVQPDRAFSLHCRF